MRKQERKSLHDKDFFLWSTTQVNILKRGDFTQADMKNIIEEIESLGTSQRSAILQSMINLLMHMLKIRYQPQKHTKSWDRSIVNAQTKIESVLIDNPSLRRQIPDFIQKAYPLAIRRASKETGLEKIAFPKECPWSATEILNGTQND